MKYYKRLPAACTAVLLGMQCLFPAGAALSDACIRIFAEEPASSGTWGNLSWSIEGDTLYVSGEGEMGEDTGSYSASDAPWNSNDTIVSAIIGEGITNIRTWAFYGCSNLRSVSLPESLKTIQFDAFEDCTALESIVLPAGLETLESWAFEGCTALSSVTIPGTLDSIPDGTFRNCTSLTEIVIPEGITSIGSDAFSGCTSLSSVTLPDSLTTIYSDAFAGTPWLAENPLLIRNGTLLLADASGDFVVPADISAVSDYAFGRCETLTSITFENPFCKLPNEYSIPESVVIRGYNNSTASYYASTYGRTFEALEGEVTPQYTYEVTPLLPPFNEYFYVKTEDPDPWSFRFVDKDSAYASEDGDGSIAFTDTVFADVVYENPETLRVSGGYLFAGSNTDGGELSLQMDIQSEPPEQRSVYNLSTGETEYYYERNSIWMDLNASVTLPRLYSETDYLITTYATTGDFFTDLDAVQSGFSDICLYSGSYIRGSLERKADQWSVSNSPHTDQTFYIQSPYSRSENRKLFASALYPYRYDSIGFPSMMSRIAKMLNSEATVAWSEDLHYIVNVTLDGTTKSYGGQGTGKGQGIQESDLLHTFTFADDASITIDQCRQLLQDYAALEVPDDVPREDMLTWEQITETAGDGAWAKIRGIASIFSIGSYTGYAYLYKQDDRNSFFDDPLEGGGSLYWSGSLGYASDAWVDGRYVDANELYIPGEVFDDHPESDLILLNYPMPDLTYKTSYSYTDGGYSVSYSDIQTGEKNANVRFVYDSDEQIWKPDYSSMATSVYEDIINMTDAGQIDAVYLDRIQLTAEEVRAMQVDANTNKLPERGYLYDGSAAPGTPFDNTGVGVCGDINLDGAIDIMDVISLNKFLLGSAHLSIPAKTAADTDANSTIDTTDVLNILKYVVELVDSLPVA